MGAETSRAETSWVKSEKGRNLWQPCGVCAMLRGGYVLWSGQNAITVSKQLDFKEQKQLKHPAMVPRNGDIYKDAVHSNIHSARL